MNNYEIAGCALILIIFVWSGYLSLVKKKRNPKTKKSDSDMLSTKTEIEVMLDQFKHYCTVILDKTGISNSDNIPAQLIEVESERQKLAIYTDATLTKLNIYHKLPQNYIDEILSVSQNTQRFLVYKRGVLENMIPKEPYIPAQLI